MCRTKKKNQNDQSKKKSSQEKPDVSFTTPGVSLMIKRLIDEPSRSGLAESGDERNN
jgi:hypothetical protein